MFAQMIAVENAARLALADFETETGPSGRMEFMSRLGSIAVVAIAIAGVGVGLTWLI